ncbi:hypothetical protein ABB37_02286 [Leptomonas pyrrhocoris]|uniref:sn-1-specific diacylglycerol lipase n=1 Tax=Leptomonas pyrrhocoris TaxID=157538 RepID=A0A0M9G7N9_LEPPY|nr:hypothetical protein ABB37_02286 [Leptomonas pyrrhocoris]XP_015662682.1 hypothetical protein ABB37_02286 [Leptomonas pyrrhocoris]KPA84242.1 hypothetical protein ABB37_02286 [Leptomonas pyrrhocoris]KPA84243.1 hypothetical protein ABB37_02286 [Leptomonas pyrrhocoris]|eukprot:XP_015662681.1 hypothetical protein ABB37_02286 [Leptomonas pyrrhocoris]
MDKTTDVDALTDRPSPSPFSATAADVAAAPREVAGARSSPMSSRTAVTGGSPAAASTTNGAHHGTAVPPPNATATRQEISSASSDFFKLLNQQKESLMALFNSSEKKESTQTTANAPSSSPSSVNEVPTGGSPCSATPESNSAVLNDAATQMSAHTASVTQANVDAPPPAFSDDHSVEDFFSCFAIPGTYTDADTVLERHAARLGATEPTHDTPLKTAADAAASTTEATTSPVLPSHVHQLRPTQFFVPTLCEVCRRTMLDTKVWPPPSSSAKAAPSFFSKLLRSPTTEPLPATHASTLSAEAQKMFATPSSTTAATTAASPVQQPFLGFGSEGYHCDVCDVALHLQCLRTMRETQACEVLAPAAHAIPEATAKTDATSSTTNDNSSSSSSSFTWDSAKALLGGYLDPNGGAYSRKDANVRFVLSGVFGLLDTVATRYPNLTPLTFVKRRQAIQDLSEAHQVLYAACTSSLQDSELMQAISWDTIRDKETQRTAGSKNKNQRRHGDDADDDGAAAAAAEQLPSVSMLTREMRSLKMDTSLLSQLTSSLTGTTISPANKSSNSTALNLNSFLPGFAKLRTEEPIGRGAAFPVQLLLWRALRYATAVYGEVYRRGSLSSTVSAALLFTVNRSSVNVSKTANDAAVTALLELPASSLRLSRWASKATEPSYVLLVDHGLGHIVVAFRGTLNTYDIMTDLAAVGVPFCGGYAHQGAAHVVNALFDHRASQRATGQPLTPATAAAATTTSATTTTTTNTTSPPSSSCVTATEGVEVKNEKDSTGKVRVVLKPYALRALETPDGLLDGLEQLAEEYPTYSILVTGHSLGGGVAVLFATRLHHDRALRESLLRRIHVIAFAPMPTLSLPAASCFDGVSCELADGGVSRTPPPSNPRQQQQADRVCVGDSSPQLTHATAGTSSTFFQPSLSSSSFTPAESRDGVRQACFPVWSVVNGFDCVPRLQVNTIDRLLRQIIGPQVAARATTSSTAGQPQQQQQQKTQPPQKSSSRATAAMMRQRCRGEGRDGAWTEENTDAAAVEMQEIPTRCATQDTNERAVPAEVRAATAAMATSFDDETKSKAAVELHGLSLLASSFSTTTGAQATREGVALGGATTAATAADSASAAAILPGCGTRAANAAPPAAAATTSASSSTECARTQQKYHDEPAWVSDARAGFAPSAVQQKDVVVKDHRASVRAEEGTSACADSDPVPTAAAEGGTDAPAANSADACGEHDLSHELHHPGRVLLLTSPWETTQNRLVDVPRGHPVMHEFFLMKYMLLQHTVDAYCGSLAEMHRQQKKLKR